MERREYGKARYTAEYTAKPWNEHSAKYTASKQANTYDCVGLFFYAVFVDIGVKRVKHAR